jgi:cell division protease FtsH
VRRNDRVRGIASASMSEPPSPSPRPPSPPAPVPPPSSGRWVVLFAALAGLATLEYGMGRKAHEAGISYSEFYRDVVDKKVASVVFDGRDLTGRFAGSQTLAGRAVTAFETSLPDVEDPALLPLLRDQGVDVTARRDHDPLIVRILAPLLPWILIIGVWVWLSRRTQAMMASGGPLAGLTRGKAKRFDRESVVPARFPDVAGLAAAKRDLMEIVDFLRDAGRFRKLGGPHSAGRSARGAAGHRQDASGAGRGR